jgi:membrane fusion protein (multidrug efflux system)
VQASAATLINTIQQIDPIYVDLNQSSVAGLQLRNDIANGKLKQNGAGQAKVMLTLEDGTPYAQAGALQFSGITVDPGTGTVTVRALFPNPKHVLLPGMFVRARIEEGVNDNALLVPIPAVGHDPQGRPTVLVVGADNKVAQHIIQTQNTLGNNWIVTGGLKAGERVIVSGIQKAPPGTLVKAVEAQDSAPAPVTQQTPAAAPAASATK